VNRTSPRPPPEGRRVGLPQRNEDAATRAGDRRTDQEHQRLKALAALQGKTIKEFVLDSTLGSDRSEEALAKLEALLDERIAETKAKGVSARTVGDIFRQAREEAGPEPDV
jgi:hypothetical protein